MPATYFPFRWMVGTFQEILDSSSGNSARIKSMTDLRVLSFAGSSEAKYSSTELNLGDFSFLLLFFFFISFLSVRLGVPRRLVDEGEVGRFFIKRVLAPNENKSSHRYRDRVESVVCGQ